jgi:hypothetical protein
MMGRAYSPFIIQFRFPGALPQAGMERAFGAAEYQPQRLCISKALIH